jgi:hypothetical protein
MSAPAEHSAAAAPSKGPANLLGAQLMQRSFGFDPLVCGECGGRLQLLAVIETASAVRRILAHLGLPTEVTGRPAVTGAAAGSRK